MLTIALNATVGKSQEICVYIDILVFFNAGHILSRTELKAKIILYIVA